MNNLHLVPECYAETEMIKILYSRKKSDVLSHSSGISNVSKLLKDKELEGFLHIGFVDNDKHNVPHYFDEFEVVDGLANIILKKHRTNNDFLFVANPAIERFLLEQLKEIGKSPADYDLPDTFRQFCNRLKTSRIEGHEGYKQMIRELNAANTSGIIFIKRYIAELINSQLQ